MKYLLLLLLLPMVVLSQKTPAEKLAFANRDKYLFTTKPVQRKFERTIPFSIEPNSQIIVPIIINGKTYNFMFDTGACTLVSRELAEELAMPALFKNLLVDGAGTTQEETFYKLSAMQIAGIDFKNVAVVAGDMKKFEDLMCVKIDGLLGTNILRSCYWKVDYVNGQLTFSDKEIKPSKDMYAVDFEESFSGTPLLRLFMGNYNLKIFMDTGYNGMFSIPDSLYFRARKGHERPFRKGYGTNMVTLFSSEHKEKYMGLLDSVYIDNKRHLIVNPITDIDSGESYLMGNKLFKEFGEMVLNWKKHRIYLPQKVVEAKERYATFGFSPLPIDNKLLVSVVWEGTEAHKKGLTAGMIVTSVNGKDTSTINHEDWCELIDLFNRNKASEINISVQDKDGKVTAHTFKRTKLLE